MHLHAIDQSARIQVNKLLPGDEILAINGEDVSQACKDAVVTLVKYVHNTKHTTLLLFYRSCTDEITLTVCQPRLPDVRRFNRNAIKQRSFTVVSQVGHTVGVEKSAIKKQSKSRALCGGSGAS